MQDYSLKIESYILRVVQFFFNYAKAKINEALNLNVNQVSCKRYNEKKLVVEIKFHFYLYYI